MVLNADNARIFGSDDDKIYLAPYGTTLPESADAELDEAFEDVGWLDSEAGLVFTPSDSIEKIRGFQGNRVIRTVNTESDLSFGFTCLETKPQVFGLQHNVLGVEGGKYRISPARSVAKVTAVVDIYDRDDDTIHHRFCIPRLEIGERSEIAISNSEIAKYAFTAEIVGEEFYGYFEDPAFTGDGPAGVSLDAVSPASGPLAGGTAVEITGTGLEVVTKVLIGTEELADLDVQADRIAGTTPAGTGEGAVDVTGQTPDGDVVLTEGFTYLADGS